MAEEDKKRLAQLVRAAKPKIELVSAIICDDKYELRFEPVVGKLATAA